MKKTLIRILSMLLLSVLCACHAEVSDSVHTVAVGITGDSRMITDNSFDSALEYQYQICLSGAEASESEWVSFNYPQIKIINQRIGNYDVYVRAVKDKKVYAQGSKTISVSKAGNNNFTIELHKNNNVSGKGTLTILESGKCSNLNVQITYDGPQQKVFSGKAQSTYTQELDNGLYVVSIVYKNGEINVGGQTFTTYVEAYSTGTVSVQTGINKVQRDVEIQFFNLRAPHIKNKVCIGYSLNGAPVEFPRTFKVTSDGIPTYTELGLVPLYANLSDVDKILASKHIEVWAEDLPSGKPFLGKPYLDSKTPEMIVVNGNPPASSFSMLRDLAVAVVRDAASIRTSAFSYDSALVKLYLGTGIKTIEAKAFSNCSKLKDIYLQDADSKGISWPNDMKLSDYVFHCNHTF